MKNYNCIVVLGPTASGKTRLACRLAFHLNGEIISADSRQVYQHLNIGTGKDLNEYLVEGQKINYHLIDLVPPSEQFYLHQFIGALHTAFEKITIQQKLPVICGGTGLYLDALRKDFSLTQIPENERLREALKDFSKAELQQRLHDYSSDRLSHVDQESKKRLVRGIEVAEYLQLHPGISVKAALPYRPYYIGIQTDIKSRRTSISERLAQRLDNGLVDEVRHLLDLGVKEERLFLFGLEYKFALQHLQGKISKEELFKLLQTAIFQFAKRQMTWFRKMEKEGVKIHWIDKDGDIHKLIRSIAL